MFVRQWTFVIAIAFAIGVGVGAQLPTRTVTPPASAPAHIEAYFTPGTECEDRIIAELGRATTIDIDGLFIILTTNLDFMDNICEAHYGHPNCKINLGEGLQGVVLEAMASGLCVIATNTKTNKKLLIPKRGFLIKPNSYKSISKQILFCFNNKNTVAIYGKNAHNLVVKKYDWIQKTKQLLGDDI